MDTLSRKTKPLNDTDQKPLRGDTNQTAGRYRSRLPGDVDDNDDNI